METNLFPNVQTLRDMWSMKLHEEQKLLKPKSITHPITPKQSIKIEIQPPTIIEKQPMITFDNEKPFIIQPIEQSPSIDVTDDFLPLPPPPPSIVFKQQAQSIATLKQNVTKMFDLDKKKPHLSVIKNNGIHHWHIARHVFRSGLILRPSRRASDSIIPLLMKTHIAQYRSRRASIDSNHFETLIDYITYNDKQMNKSIIKRTISDTSDCIQRNKLNDTIAQYEIIMRHLKNYDKFMATHPKPSTIRKLIDIQGNEENLALQKSSIRNRQTQSLARNAGRTFTEFFMNDMLLSQSTEPRRLSTVHVASQTDLSELTEKINSIRKKDKKTVLNEFNTVINNIVKETPITPHVIVINPPAEVEKKEVQPEKPLMQRLFEGKKTAYSPNDLHMESTRIPEELANTFEIAKGKCFFPTEQIIYTTKMIKIDRRGYKQHVRLLCLTSERVYIITKKKPYPKEALTFDNILGISCTPRRDGFICLHTRETRDDRGDWIFVVDHPCEFITQFFMTMGRNHNNDHFLKIETKFQHSRRNLATLTDDSTIEARPSDTFHIAFENYEVLVIYTP